MYCCSILQHVRYLFHFHQQDESGLYFAIIVSKKIDFLVYICSLRVCLEDIELKLSLKMNAKSLVNIPHLEHGNTLLVGQLNIL